MQWTPWDWPFFAPVHHEIAQRAADWRAPVDDHDLTEADLPDACRAIARSLGAAGLLHVPVPPDGQGVDVRALCLAREAIGYRSALADNVITMQGIGTSAIARHGTPEQRARWLDPARRGAAIAAFALTEPGSGSDVAAITTSARREGDSFVIDGAKTFISNAPFADHYIVVARTGEAPGARGLSAFMVESGTPGLIPGPALPLIAPHPVATLTFEGCRIPAGNLIGAPGRGFAIAMETFDIFRTSVGAAAIGMARRALDETLARVHDRHLFGAAMAELPGVQTQLADMLTDIELGALAVYRAAWLRDTRGGRCTREVSMAKMVATENASRAIDRAVQLWGGAGVTRGSVVERLYRDVRASRIYEGASEVQKMVIGRDLVARRP